MAGRIVVFAALLAAIPSPACALDRHGWDRASTIGEAGLVVAALGVPAIKGDGRGALEAGGGIGAAALVSRGLKEAFPELRPDRSDRRSFPSGHASISFAAAASLHQRYGWRVGAPATLVAAFVGYGRIAADKHHWYDVVVGAGIGEASGFLIGSPRNGHVRVFPWGDTHGAGATLGARF